MGIPLKEQANLLQRLARSEGSHLASITLLCGVIEARNLLKRGPHLFCFFLTDGSHDFLILV